MVYTSSSLALAALEFFVHLDPSVTPNDLVFMSADLPDGDVNIERLQLRDLPANWRNIDNRDLRVIGSEWASLRRSVALHVPSAVIEDEWNVLLNPLHIDFAKIQVNHPKPFRFDERMFR
jgi:RES domain-containing protein